MTKSSHGKARFVAPMIIAGMLFILFVGGVTAALAQPTLTITQIDPSRYPDEIDTFVRLSDEDGNLIFGLTKEDFTVTEDGIVATQYDVIPAIETGEGINWVLVIDTSGSMVGDRLNATKQAAHAFVDSMKTGSKAAIVRFADEAVLVQGLTQYKSLLHNAINSLEANGATALFDGVYEGLTELATATRPRAIIAISDGDESGISEHTLDEVIGLANLDSLGIPCYTIGLVVPDPTTLQTIAYSTQAEYIDVSDPDQLPDIYYEISQAIRSQYQVTFATPNPVFDGSIRTVRITYNSFPNFSWDEIQYRVDQAPIIIRTPETIALSDEPQQPGTEFPISAEITDNTGVVGAWLYYRTTPPVGFNRPYSNPQLMEFLGEDIYEGTIPPDISNPFGEQAYAVDYYLEASDGYLTSQSPWRSPQSFPWQIPIYPNEFPILTHDPVPDAGVGISIPLSCTVFDTTENVAGVSVYYRRSNDIFYDQLPMTYIGSNEWIATIPGSAMTNAGIDYWIVAYDNYNLRSFSPADRSYWHIAPGGEPGPINLTAESGFHNYVPLNWTAPTEHPVLGYNVYRSTSLNGNYIRIAQGIGPNSFIDENVINGVTYWYYVTAIYPEPWGESLPSNIAEATPGVTGNIVVIVPDERGIPGDTLIVSIDVNNSIDVAGGDFTVHFCPEMLQALEVRPGELIAPGQFNDQIFDDSLNFSFSRNMPMSGAAGTLAEIVFRVSPEAILGTTCTVNPTRAELYNIDAVPLLVGVQPGVVSLGSKGDVNGDGRINAQDAILTMRMAVDDPTFNPTPYQRWAAEVDGTDVANDNLPDAYDVTLILRVAVGYIVVIPKEPHMLVGEQQQFLVLGGQPSYTWTVMDSEVGVISTMGMFTAIGPGLAQVRAVDQMGRSDVSRMFPVTLTRDTSPDIPRDLEPVSYHYEVEVVDDQLLLALYLENAVDVSNGSLLLNYDPDLLTLEDLGAGEMLQDVMFRSNISQPGQVRIAFASSEALETPDGKLFHFYFTPQDMDEFGLDELLSTEIYIANDLGELIPVIPTETLGLEDAESRVISTFLAKNYPNPFSAHTTITFGIPSRQAVEVSVYNLAGQRIRTLQNGSLDAGIHTLTWDGRDNRQQTVANGVYLYRLKAAEQTLTERMVILR